MKFFMVSMFSVLMLSPASAHAANQESFIEKRQSRAMENQGQNMGAADRLDRKSDDKKQEQQEKHEEKKSLRYQMEEDQRPKDD